MSKEKRDGNVAARTACRQMVNRLKTQACEVENWCGTHVKCKGAPAERTLADCVLAELESHYRDREGAGPDDLLEPEETYAPGAVPPLHSDIEFLYVIDLSSAKRATLRGRNVRGAIWKQLCMASEQSCEAVLCDVLHNGLLLADFRYEF